MGKTVEELEQENEQLKYNIEKLRKALSDMRGWGKSGSNWRSYIDTVLEATEPKK